MCKYIYMYEFYLFKLSFARKNQSKIVEENVVSVSILQTIPQ